MYISPVFSCRVTYVGDIPLKPVSTQKYLGVVFDDQLRWDSHISTVCKKVSYYLYWINAHYKHMPNDVLKLLIDSLVLSRLTYALPVWGPAISSTSAQLGSAYSQEFEEILSCLCPSHWLPVDTLIRHRTLCTMHQLYHKTFNLLDPPILFGPQHTYSTQCPPTFANIERCRLSRTHTFFRYQGAKWWNDLPK